MLAFRILLVFVCVSFVFAKKKPYFKGEKGPGAKDNGKHNEYSGIEVTNVRFNIFQFPNRSDTFQNNLLKRIEKANSLFKNINGSSSSSFALASFANEFFPAFMEAIAFTKEFDHENMEFFLNRFGIVYYTNILVDDMREILLPSKNKPISNGLRILGIFDNFYSMFVNSKMFFRECSLIVSPLLITMATLVALMYPLLLEINPLESEKENLPCKFYDLLLEYRAYAVDARMDKMNINDQSTSTLTQLGEARTGKYEPSNIKCYNGCMNSTKKIRYICIKDEYGFNEYYIQAVYGTSCVKDYAALVKKRVEDFFPVEMLSSLCKPRTPTGNFN